MCGICGCSEENMHAEDHVHKHDHLSQHSHDDHLIDVEQDILAKNNQLASHNHHYFQKENILALNIMSSPGSGKTTLLAKTIADLKHEIEIAVVVGDQETDYDAETIKKAAEELYRLIQVKYVI